MSVLTSGCCTANSATTRTGRARIHTVHGVGFRFASAHGERRTPVFGLVVSSVLSASG